MDSPIVRILMATLFTTVLVVVTFIVVGLLLGDYIGRLGMVVTLMVAAIGWWVVAQRLFRINQRG
ncbi:hypothetical protein LKO27_04860 [Tessaracoccus sp. OS52]|uniref:hypothetical protein n=1 Tax=Tessaracoccus sp. OS52 TaxID=2886691 RepID=UPI001D10E243|nr:hypothetical protein [Tessaracoccus sp. OS52]MCC2592747.1 hypothetical protein [Tessaracoccus sp. OS52]